VTPSSTAAAKVVSAGTTLSGTAVSSSNNAVDKAALSPAYITPYNVGEWKALRRVVQSPLESGAANAGVSTLPPVLATASLGTNVVAGTATPSGRIATTWVYVPATVSVQHVRFAYVTALPADIVVVRVGIWNASSFTNYATSLNLVNATSSGQGSNAPSSDNSRFQTVSGVTVLTTQSAASTTLDVACTGGRPVVNMTYSSGTGFTTNTRITAVTTISGGYRLTLSAATTSALTAGTASTWTPNPLIDTRRQVTSFNQIASALPTPYPAFSSPVSLAAGWWVVGVWQGGAASAASPTLVSSPTLQTITAVPMVDANGPSSAPGSNSFKTGGFYFEAATVTSSVLPTVSPVSGSYASTLYLDLTY
jgi:hypothetical protein